MISFRFLHGKEDVVTDISIGTFGIRVYGKIDEQTKGTIINLIQGFLFQFDTPLNRNHIVEEIRRITGNAMLIELIDN